MLLDTTYSPSILTFGPLNPPQNRNHSHSHMHAGPVVCQNGWIEYASLLCKPTLTHKSQTLWHEQLSIKTNYVVDIGPVGGGCGVPVLNIMRLCFLYIQSEISFKCFNICLDCFVLFAPLSFFKMKNKNKLHTLKL